MNEQSGAPRSENRFSESDQSEWEMASSKKMMSYATGFLISGSFGASLLFYYFEVEVGLPVLLLGIECL